MSGLLHWKTPQSRQRSLMALHDCRSSGRSKRWLGRVPVGEHCHPLVKKLIELMNEELISMNELGKRAGLKGHTIADWRTCRNPSAQDLEACFNALGYELRPVKRREKMAA